MRLWRNRSVNWGTSPHRIQHVLPDAFRKVRIEYALRDFGRERGVVLKCNLNLRREAAADVTGAQLADGGRCARRAGENRCGAIALPELVSCKVPERKVALGVET